MASNSFQKDTRKLLRRARKAGFIVESCGKHLRIVTPTGDKLTCAVSPSCSSTYENLKSKLRKAGLEI